jgi:hypothetical protein
MSARTTKLPDDSKEAFERYIKRLEREYAPRYRRATSFNKTMWVIGQGTAITAGALTAFIAALVNEAQFVRCSGCLCCCLSLVHSLRLC